MNPKDLKAAREQIRKGVIGMLIDHPFFSSLAMRLHVQADATIPTFATDGKQLLYNPDFALSLPVDHVKGVIAHEVLHCSLLHILRRGSRNPERWNMACDYAVNLIVSQSGLKLPAGALIDPKYKDMSAEAIYAALPDDAGQQAGRGWDFGGIVEPSAGGGAGDENKDGRAPGGATAEEIAALAREWTIAIQQAAQAARMKGKTPAGMDRLIGEVVAPKVDPADLLAEFVERSAAADYSFSRVNRRYAAHGLILPGMRSDSLPPLVLVNDTSGSRGKGQLQEFGNMLSAILSRWTCSITVLHVDSSVARVERFDSEDLPLKLNPSGGGGTSFAPAFNWVREQGEDPAALVYFTDMYGDFPKEAPPYPVMWVSDSSIKSAPFGRVVNV